MARPLVAPAQGYAPVPLSMQITDAEADAFARDHAPVGWALSGATIQGRDQFNRRVICATFVRHEAAGNFFQGGPYDRA